MATLKFVYDIDSKSRNWFWTFLVFHVIFRIIRQCRHRHVCDVTSGRGRRRGWSRCDRHRIHRDRERLKRNSDITMILYYHRTGFTGVTNASGPSPQPIA